MRPALEDDALPARKRRARRWLLLVPGVALGLTLAISWRWLSPLPAQPPPPRKGAGLRVLTWNVGTLSPFGFRLRDNLIERVAEEIASSAPDVVALQEVRDEGQIAVLRAALARRGVSFEATWQVLEPSQPDLLSVFLFRPGEREALEDFRFETSVTFVVHAVRVRGASVVNVHAPPRSASGRRAVLGELAAWAKTLPHPVVIAGDFNLDPAAGHMVSLPGGGDSLLDKKTFALLSETVPVGTTVGPTTALRVRIDHVRASRGAVVVEHVNRGARRLPMDHDPVLAELCLHVAAGARPCERCAPGADPRP